MYTALDSGTRGALRLEVGDDGWLVVRVASPEEPRAILSHAEVAGLVRWLVEQYGEPVTREAAPICRICLCPTPPGAAHVQHYGECALHDPATCDSCREPDAEA